MDGVRDGKVGWGLRASTSQLTLGHSPPRGGAAAHVGQVYLTCPGRVGEAGRAQPANLEVDPTDGRGRIALPPSPLPQSRGCCCPGAVSRERVSTRGEAAG